MKRKAIFHGGTVPGTCRYQVGLLRLQGGVLSYRASGRRSDEEVSVTVPVDDVTDATLRKRKSYSSTDYILDLRFRGKEGREETLQLELVVWLKRGRALRIGQRWVDAIASLRRP